MRQARHDRVHGSAQSEVRAVLNERFADASPANAYYSLLDQGAYLASPSTMCRILRQHGEVGTDRCRQAAHPPRAVPELVADAPSVVWAWDITKLRGPDKGVWYCLYTIINCSAATSSAGWSPRVNRLTWPGTSSKRPRASTASTKAPSPCTPTAAAR